MGANATAFVNNLPSVSQTIKEYCEQNLPEIYNKCKKIAGTGKNSIYNHAFLKIKSYLRINFIFGKEVDFYYILDEFTFLLIQ